MERLSATPVELPINPQGVRVESVDKLATEKAQGSVTEAVVARPETPLTSHPPSEANDSTTPTTPSSIQPQSAPVAGDATPVPLKASQRPIPVIPVLPKAILGDAAKPGQDRAEENTQGGNFTVAKEDIAESADEPTTEETRGLTPAPKAWSTPKLWTGLFNPATANSTAASSDSGRATVAHSLDRPSADSLSDALKNFNAVSNEAKVVFLEPRGLVNTGNMCYMNSVSGLFLQPLLESC